MLLLGKPVAPCYGGPDTQAKLAFSRDAQGHSLRPRKGLLVGSRLRSGPAASKHCVVTQLAVHNWTVTHTYSPDFGNGFQ